jgi:hypothetical protein
MKKLFAVLAIFSLVFTACEEEDTATVDNSDVIGIWTSGTQITLDIVDGTWIMVSSIPSRTGTYNGTWTRNANTLDFTLPSGYTFATASLSEGKLFFIWKYWSSENNYTFTKKIETPLATVKINNQSFTEITDVIWNNVSFAENQYENSIKSGNNVTKNVEAGGSYIFFKRKSSPITARTRDVIIVEAGKSVEFTFNDNTVIVEVNNPDNNGTLGVLQSTVVWWDDAEGEMQPYFLRQNFAGYYGTLADLSLSGSYTSYFYFPKNGKKSIAVGNSATSLLHLKITLTKKAKLSFWYANRGNASFSINDDTKFESNVNIAWSFIEFELESGMNDLIWKNTSSSAYMYFFLDDILIYYTE